MHMLHVNCSKVLCVLCWRCLLCVVRRGYCYTVISPWMVLDLATALCILSFSTDESVYSPSVVNLDPLPPKLHKLRGKKHQLGGYLVLVVVKLTGVVVIKSRHWPLLAHPCSLITFLSLSLPYINLTLILLTSPLPPPPPQSPRETRQGSSPPPGLQRPRVVRGQSESGGLQRWEGSQDSSVWLSDQLWPSSWGGRQGWSPSYHPWGTHLYCCSCTSLCAVRFGHVPPIISSVRKSKKIHLYMYKFSLPEKNIFVANFAFHFGWSRNRSLKICLLLHNLTCALFF